jgi:hypothetical protein
MRILLALFLGGVILLTFMAMAGRAIRERMTPEERRAYDAKRAAEDEADRKAEAADKAKDVLERFPFASQRVAKDAVRSMLKAPSTAKLDALMLDRDGNRFGLVLVQADAQNGFGAMIRGFYCVVTVGKEDGNAALGKDPVRECKSPPTDAQIASIKKRNGWKAK